VNDDDIRRTAIHEAGHAVVAEALGIRCDRLSVVSDGKMRGRGDYTWPLGRRGGRPRIL